MSATDTRTPAVTHTNAKRSCQMNVLHKFQARLVDHTGEGTMTDGSILWEVVSDDGERVASCSTEGAAKDLEVALNIALTDWCEVDESDRIAS